MNRELPIVEHSFRSRFCKHFDCPEDRFEQAILLKSLHRRSLPLGWLIFRLHPGYFETDYRILHQIGSVTSHGNLLAEARDVRHDYQRLNDFGFLRRFFNLRISGQRLLGVANEVWGAYSESEGKK